MTTRCPTHPDITLDPKKWGWFCDECGALVLSYDVAPRPSAVAAVPTVVVERWPSLVAIPVATAFAEHHPVMRLHRLCDAIEIFVRFLCIVGLAHLRDDSAAHPFPPVLQALARDNIQRPTLGVWGQLLEATHRALMDHVVYPRELNTLVTQLLSLLFVNSRDNPEAEASNEHTRSVLALRNVLVHGGAMSHSAAVAALAEWEPRIAQLFRSARILDELSLVYVTRPACLLLRGSERTAVVYAPSDKLAPGLASLTGHVTLLHDDHILDLWPLCAVGDDHNTPMVYYRADDQRLLFAALGGDRPITEIHGALADFRRLFLLDEGASSRVTMATDFEDELRTESASLIGRSAEIAHAKRLLKAAQRGVFWIHGPGGIGKSFLAARLADDLRGDPRRALRVAWRFKSGDPRCTREAFLRHGISEVAVWLGLQAPRADDVAALERTLRELLETVALLQPASPRARAQRVIIMLDGMDEIAHTDSTFVHVPFQLSFPNVVWVCVGRSEGELSTLFEPAACCHVFADGVPPMTSDDVRAMMLEPPGDLKYGLLRRDAPGADGRIENAFVEAVVANAHGLPLYVRCLVEDLLAGEFTFYDERRLPRGLTEYYRRILERLSVGDMQALLTPLVVTVALAGCPLDEEVLAELLTAARRLVADADGRAFLRRALVRVQSLLRAAPTPWGTRGWMVVHETFHEHLVASDDLTQQRALVGEDYRRATNDWRSVSGHAARSYLWRHGPSHLASTGAYDDFLERLCEVEFADGARLFLRTALFSREALPDHVAALVDRAITLRADGFLSFLVSALEATIASGRLLRAEGYFAGADALCAVDPSANRRFQVLLDACRAWVARARGRLVEAITLFEVVLADDAGAGIERVRFQYAQCLRESGSYDRARCIYRELYAALREAPDRRDEYLLFAQQLADILYVQGELRAALAMLEEASSPDDERALPVETAEALRIRGHIFRMGEKPDAALSHYRRARELFSDASHASGVARIETNLAETLVSIDPARALAHARLAVEMNHRLSAPIEVGKAHNAAGLAQLMSGDTAAAEAEFRIAEEIQERVGYRSGIGMVLANRVCLSLCLGDAVGARDVFERQRRLFESVNAYPILVYRSARLLTASGFVDAELQRTLDETAFRVEWLDGRDAFDARVVSQGWRRG
ncbi:MAG: tetratricopeptide repeat protein [Polyangiaceae bacterium]|nr:tetratricopeptide repeat protein [Polyangiaceae bacterium]